MEGFSQLYEALDGTTSTTAKVEAMVSYFGKAPPKDAAWALYFLTGRRLKRLIPAESLHIWTRELSGFPDWLLTECYAAAGDFAEAISLLIGASGSIGPGVPLSEWIGRLLSLPALDPPAQHAAIEDWWRALPRRHLYLLIKLTTGELRVGVSDTLVVRAIAKVAGLGPQVIAHRLMGSWEPTADFFTRLVAKDTVDTDLSRPYPFFLASPLEGDLAELGERSDWLVERKWDGIRGQLIHRGGQVFLWSRGEELITERFPELVEAGRMLPNGIAIDGEVVAYDFARNLPHPFSFLQRRIGRKKLTPKILSESPAAMIAYDLLEEGGQDIRELPLEERRRRLSEILIANRSSALFVSPLVDSPDWPSLAEERTRSRALEVEGLMLKRLGSTYRTGRKRGDWWKWKIDPYTIDAVLLYAQPGHGRRATLYTDYTFGLWDHGELVPVAKAYSGLSDAEILEMDKWIRAHTLARHGPVRAVEPTQVFELHFEAIAPSSRHRSGIAVRFPRIARFRTDKKAEDADTLQTLQAMASGSIGHGV